MRWRLSHCTGRTNAPLGVLACRGRDTSRQYFAPFEIEFAICQAAGPDTDARTIFRFGDIDHHRESSVAHEQRDDDSLKNGRSGIGIRLSRSSSRKRSSRSGQYSSGVPNASRSLFGLRRLFGPLGRKGQKKRQVRGLANSVRQAVWRPRPYTASTLTVASTNRFESFSTHAQEGHR